MPRILRVGLPDRYVTHGKPALLHAEVGFTGKAIAERIEAAIGASSGALAAPERWPRSTRSSPSWSTPRRCSRPTTPEPSSSAMRDDYVQTAIRLGGALEPVARVEDVVIARPDGAAALAGPRVLADGGRPGRRARLAARRRLVHRRPRRLRPRLPLAVQRGGRDGA